MPESENKESIELYMGLLREDFYGIIQLDKRGATQVFLSTAHVKAAYEFATGCKNKACERVALPNQDMAN